MKIRKYWLSAALSFLGIAASAWAPAGTPQACRPEVKQIRDDRVSLVWNTVEPVYGIFDDFEGHSDFAINSPGQVGWSYFDMDHARTVGIGEYVYENSGSPMAFMVWNPSKTIPAYTYDKAQPHSGKKCLVSMATSNEARRNDWLISPDLAPQNFTDDITLSFWARALTASYGEELVKIAYSTTDKDINSFVFLDNGAATSIPESSKEHPDMYFYSFRIPKEARYVAINCVTWSGHALFIDDVVIASNKVNPTKSAHNYLTGFNLYRDGVKINETLITEHAYTDVVPTFGDHTYQVESVFETGAPVKGELVTINVPNIHLLPFVENWESYEFETNFWEVSCPATEATWTNKCFWKMDYLQKTLYNESASFYPSGLTDYKDYCLTSMEFDATGLDGVMLCYDLALYAYTGFGSVRGEEKMLLEVFDGTQWIKVDERTDAAGHFGYTRFYVDLTSQVAGKKFKIRFNAQGKDCYNIIEWYIGYVRIYEKAKANVSGTVLCGTEQVAGVTVTLTSAEEDVYTATTAADGTYSIPNVDAGSYTVEANLKGYNPYKQAVTVNKGSQTVDIAITRPQVALASASQSHTLAAEATENGTISLSNTGNGGSRVGMWIDYQQKTVSAAPSFETLKTFNPSDIMQASIAFDGEYFYMAQNDEYVNDALIYKYDKEANFLGTFMPNIHLRRWFAMAYDGENFYSVHGDNIIRIINMKQGILLGEIPTGIDGLCHIAYDELRDAFWVGSLNTLALVGRNGETLVNEIGYSTEQVLFSGSAYDPYFKGGPCLWIMDRSRGNHPSTTLTKAVIRRIDLTDMQVKDDYSFPCDQWPGFQYGNNVTGPVWGEGLFGTTRYKEGHFVLMGVIMSAPGLVGIVDMYEVPDWLKMNEYGFDVEAAGSKQVSYTVDAASLRENDTRKATVTFRMDPYAAPLQFEVTATVNAKAQYAKPLALRAVVENEEAARLTWTAPQAATAPASYNIYRDGEKIASATALTYTDNNLKIGAYSYAVSAVYAGGHESALSNEAKVNVRVGAACYAPFGLIATNVKNNSISLLWKDPSEAGTQATSLRWDNGVNADGIVAGGDFMGAVSWSPQDLEPYRNMKLSMVSFVPMTRNADFTLKIFENDVLVHSQKIEKTDITPKKVVYVVLNKDYVINNRKDLRVGIECSNFRPADDNDNLVLGVDAGPAVDKKGNWLYMSAYGWFTLGAAGVSDANFNIALELAPKTAAESPAKGFNIYRNGTKITATPVTGTQYSDPMTVAGLYTYTVTALHDNGESYACAPASARIVDIKAHDAPEDLSARISMNRDVKLHWNYPNTRVTKAAYKPFSYISHFDVTQSNESAVATDGKFIYTSHRNRSGVFHKYDMEGQFLETFEIEGVGMISDLTHDGTYFYAGGASKTIYRLDFENRRLVDEITVTETARHLAYIPDLNNGNGGFEIGDWTTSYFVSMTGAYLGSGYTGLDGAFGAAYHEGKLYYSQQGSAGLCEVMEVDFTTLKPTGNSEDLSDSKLLNLNDNSLSGGLDLYVAPNGTAVLLLSIQQPSPARNKIVFLEATRNYYVSGFNIYRDGKKINTDAVPTRDYVDVVTTPGNYTYTVSAVYVDEQESAKSNPVAVKIVTPTRCEAPVEVEAYADKRDVCLQWTSVLDRENRGDDMESYTHLATGTVGKWITVDGDEYPVYEDENFSFGGMDNARTFFVLDEEKIGERNSGYAYSGTKSFVCLGAWDENFVYKNNDWLITEASTANAAWVSFMARGLYAGQKERFYMAYSTMGPDTSNFIHMTAFAERVDYLWTRFTYQLPEGVKYVAIHYTSEDGRALFIDDMSMGTGSCPFTTVSDYASDEELTEAVVGYYIYRNGVRLNSEPLKSCSFFDGNLANDTYTYEIQALYNTSCESAKSEPVKVNVDYEYCSAPENLKARVSSGNVVLSWSEPSYDADKELTYIKNLDVSDVAGFTVAATYYVACKWDAADLMGVFGYRIKSVAAAFAEAPSALSLLIYQGGEVVYEQDVLDYCTDMFSVYELAQPYQIDFSKDLMVAFRIEAEAGVGTMLCTPDVPDNGYSNLFSEDGKNFFSVYGTWSGNWFMVVSLDMPARSGGDLEGYRVYRDGELLTQTLLPNTTYTYTDKEIEDGTYRYQVAAVYTSCGEKRSNTTATVTVGNETEEEYLLSVWPNPARETVWIAGEYRKLEILDMQGKVRLTQPAGKDGQLDISAFPAGVYFMRFETARGQKIRKLVVW